MEQKNVMKIKQNLPRLIELTRCSAIFLSVFISKSTFSREDVQLIEAEAQNKGPMAASRKLYDLLESKTGSFEVLLEALQSTDQTGALDVLTMAADYKKSVIKTSHVKFSSKAPKYITDYIANKYGKYLIVCSDDSKLVCEWILESTPDSKLCGLAEIMESVSAKPEFLDLDTILVVNLEKNLDPLYVIERNPVLKIVLVIQMSESQLQKKITLPKSEWQIVQTSIQWKDLSSYTKLEITSGLKQSLALESNQLVNALKIEKSKTIVELINGNFPCPENLFFETIPPPTSYYVKRTLQTRHVVKQTILDDDLVADFVLLTGLDRHVLTELCGKKLHETSSNLLRHRNETRKIVLLENDLDFNRIVTTFPNYSVHLLDVKENRFIWKKTRGSISIIQKHASSEQLALEESEFTFDILAQNSFNPVCISDTPGKGKSVLLANIATEIKKKRQDTGIVAFIIIKELIKLLKENTSTSLSSSVIISGISSFLSKSSLGNEYLTANKKYLYELMLDGFDEIDVDDSDFAFECIKFIRSTFTETRIWITTRPHMLHELELRLETLGYNVSPFSKNDQMKFLTSFWANRIEQSDKTVVSSFAIQCLKSLEATLGHHKDEIAGIPLQCLLIGEVYEEDALRFVNSSSPKVAVFSSVITSVTDLYDKLVDKMLSKFRDRYNDNNLDISEIFAAHVRIAVQEIFISHLSKLSEFLVHNMSMQEIFNFGLVHSTNIFSTPRFIHRTIAEYFVARFISQLLRKHPSEMVSDFLYFDVMMTDENQILIYCSELFYERYPKQEICIKYSKFRQNIVCYFLNSFIKTSPFTFRNICFIADADRFRFISEACAYHNLVDLFQYVIPKYYRNASIVNERFLIKVAYFADAIFLNCIASEYMSLNRTPVLNINVCRFDDGGNYFDCNDPLSNSEYDNISNRDYDKLSINLLQLVMRKGD